MDIKNCKNCSYLCLHSCIWNIWLWCIYFLRIHTLTKLSFYDIDEIQSAVVDLGTSQCRFGSAGQDLPRHVFRTVSGCDIHDLWLLTINTVSSYCMCLNVNTSNCAHNFTIWNHLWKCSLLRLIDAKAASYIGYSIASYHSSIIDSYIL